MGSVMTGGCVRCTRKASGSGSNMGPKCGFQAVWRGWRGGRLFGAAEALREGMGTPLRPDAHAEYDRDVAVGRAQLDDMTFTVAWAAGRAMPQEQAIAYALERDS